MAWFRLATPYLRCSSAEPRHPKRVDQPAFDHGTRQLRDGEAIDVKFDGPHNRLSIVPNDERSGEATKVDGCDDDIEIEEVDQDSDILFIVCHCHHCRPCIAKNNLYITVLYFSF